MEELLPTQWIWASACLWVRVCVFSNLCMCTNVIVLFVNGCLLHVTAFCKMHPFLGISLMSFFFFFSYCEHGGQPQVCMLLLCDLMQFSYYLHASKHFVSLLC